MAIAISFLAIGFWQTPNSEPLRIIGLLAFGGLQNTQQLTPNSEPLQLIGLLANTQQRAPPDNRAIGIWRFANTQQLTPNSEPLQLIGLLANTQQRATPTGWQMR